MIAGQTKRNLPPALLVDGTLGRLARWLRLAGYDVAFLRSTDHSVVMREARAAQRVIVTRDQALARRCALPVILIRGHEVSEQLGEIERELGRAAPPHTRCAVCNTPLKAISREAAQPRVPPYVWRTQQAFHECPNCRRVYWQGSHWQGIHRQLEDVD
ncbi:MAG: Mut7-C RNAse domain-containing protein [Anaerolineae bacterium]